MRDKILVSVIVAIIVAPIGYLTNDYLARSKLSIVNVEPLVLKAKFPVNRSLLTTKLISNTFFFNTGYPLSDFPESADETALSWLRGSLLTAHTQAHHQSEQFKDLLAGIEQFPDDTAIDTLAGEVPSVINLLPVLNAGNSPLTARLIRNYVSSTISELETFGNDLDKQLDRIDNFEPERSGEIEFLVTVLNAGNTDGLLNYDGRLYIDGFDNYLPIKVAKQGPIPSSFKPWETFSATARDPLSTTIRSRSITQLRFKIDFVNSTLESAAELKSLVMKKHPVKGKIELLDFSEEPIGAYDFVVPTSN